MKRTIIRAVWITGFLLLAVTLTRVIKGPMITAGVTHEADQYSGWIGLSIPEMALLSIIAVGILLSLAGRLPGTH